MVPLITPKTKLNYKYMNSNLLKEAIADAKAVRATALANAKLALEEAFAPRIQSMISSHLQQEAEGDEEDIEFDPKKKNMTQVTDDGEVKNFEVDNYICWGTPNDLKTYQYWQRFFNKVGWHPYEYSKDYFTN